MPFIRRVATLLIFPSQASQGFYLGNGSHGIPFRLVYEPVDVRRFHRELISPSDICKIRTELGIDSQEVVVGTVGNINPAKGYEYLFSAARLILDRLENIKFLIVGARLENQEAYYRQLQDQITTLNLTDHVILAGYRENVPCFLGLFDLFVMSSISEGFPLAVLEAMAMGLPVVATAVGGIPEQIIDGQSGVIVPPRNVEALAEAIMALLSDPAKRHAIGQEARQRAQSLFSIDICVKEHVYAYEHALRL